MGFEVPADAYGRFMGRFSEPLAVQFADAAGVTGGQRALDVGCGPGVLTAVLVDRLGADSVVAVDPSASFVAAVRERLPAVDVRQGVAESLPWEDGVVDLALAELVVHFMKDPVAGLREMARVTRAGGTVAACVWDHAGRSGPISDFWEVVKEADPGERGEGLLAGTERGHLGELFREAGLASVEEGELTVEARFESFEDWWEPYTFGVGPAGAYVAALDDAGREQLRAACQAHFPSEPFSITATAWNAVGRVP